MADTSGRLLELLGLLQVPRSWTGTELAERLEVTTRTVRNDVERLRMLGYRVDGLRGSAGGYRLAPGSKLPPLLLDDADVIAITASLLTASTGSVAGMEETAQRALAKLEQVMPHALRRRADTLRDAVVQVPTDTTPPTVDPEVLAVISAACRDREVLRFDYRTHDSERTRGASSSRTASSTGDAAGTSSHTTPPSRPGARTESTAWCRTLPPARGSAPPAARG